MVNGEKFGKYIGRGTAALCAAAVIAAALGLKMKTPEMPKDVAPFSGKPDGISALISADTGFAAALNGEESAEDSQEDNSSAEEESSASSQPPEKAYSDGGEKEKNEQPENDTAPDIANYYYYVQTDGTSQSTDTQADNSGGGNGSEKSDKDDTSASDKNQLADDASRADTPGDAPTEGVETDIEYFTASIEDGETVDDPQYAFTITHLQKELTVKRVDVYVNATRFPWTGEVTLSSENGGENLIRIAVTYVDGGGKVISAYREYTVFLAAKEPSVPQEPQFQTDLYDHTRSDAHMRFLAYVSGDAQDVKRTVYCNNTKLTADGNYYECDLEMGINSIRVKASYSYGGESYEISEEYRIKLIAETTPETAPYLAYHNVPKTVRGSLYTLDLAPRDFNGNTLYYSNLYVRLNGVTLNYKWDGEYTSYLLELSAGENTLDIRVTDNEGRYTDYSFVITCLAAQDGEVIGYATLEADADVLGLGIIMPEVQIEIRQGESASRSILRALENAGFTVEYTGDLDGSFYLARISRAGIAFGAQIDASLNDCIEADSDVHFTEQRDDNSLGEKDFTNASGWMFSVNGHYTSYGTSDMHLKDGDKIRMRFTLAYGKDIGGYMGGGSGYDVCY